MQVLHERIDECTHPRYMRGLKMNSQINDIEREIFELTTMGEQGWTPQYKYWTRPRQMDDGCQNQIE